MGKIVAAAVCMLGCTASWAGRPLATEDAGVTPKGQCELESVIGRQARPATMLGSMQLACGIDGRTQLGIGMSRERADQHNDYASIGGKTVLGKHEASQAAVAVAYTLLSGRAQADAMKYMGLELKGVVSLPYRAWLLHANIGLHYLRQERRQRVIWAVAAERPVLGGKLDLMGEIHGDDRDRPWIQLAARWHVLPERLVLDASYGIQSGGERARLATLGMKLAF